MTRAGQIQALVDAHVDGQRAGRAEAFRDVAAYLLDRADQYEAASGSWVALSDAAADIMNGRVDEVKGYGDLDENLYRRVDRLVRPRVEIVEVGPATVDLDKVAGDCPACGKRVLRNMNGALRKHRCRPTAGGDGGE